MKLALSDAYGDGPSALSNWYGLSDSRHNRGIESVFTATSNKLTRVNCGCSGGALVYLPADN
jgi:hypothetical protein